MFSIQKDGAGWRVVDQHGHLHSARITLGDRQRGLTAKQRAQRQADTLNAKFAAAKAKRDGDA